MAILSTDNAGRVFRTDLADGATVRLADYALTFTDIAVTPKGDVFAVTYSGLYELDLERETYTYLRGLGGSANGLASDANGNLYVSYNSYGSDIDVLSSTTYALKKTIGIPDGNPSAGDVHVEGRTLYYSTTSNELLTVNLKTGRVTDEVYHGISSLYGLQYEDGELFGLAGNDVYVIEPRSGRAEFVYELPISSSIYGAATLGGVRIDGTRRDDVLVADANGSRMFGRDGGDMLLGSDRADVLKGESGRDYLFGDGGHDRIDGGRGRDLIDGGAGKDVLFGGRGADVFVFEKGDGRDRIRDFEDDRDTIEISAALIRGKAAIGNLLDRHGEDLGRDVALDFGQHGRIVVEDVADLKDLRDDILIF